MNVETVPQRLSSLGTCVVSSENNPSCPRELLLLTGGEQTRGGPGVMVGQQEDRSLALSVFPLSPSPTRMAGAGPQVADSCRIDLEGHQRPSILDVNAARLSGPCLDSFIASKFLSESWIVTPPPCFTASGSGAELEENPLENLLIEHPSMSVYHTHHGAESTTNSSTSVQENIVAVPPPLNQHQDGVVQQAQGRLQMLASHSSAEQIKLTRSHQRQQYKALGKHLTRKCTERNNKTRLVKNSCKKQSSARNRALHPSGCMSGRRSQRAH